MVTLREQRDVRYDDRGRATVRRYVVYVVQDAGALEDWEPDLWPWRPSYQDRPVIRARSTEASFGESPVSPQPPAETVTRGQGNAVDRAVLLIALLRQAQIRAELVLYDDGALRDPDPDLPGLGAFGELLVRARVAARDVWIDLQHDLARPGQLSAAAYGRRAPVIADDTRGLSTTPPMVPAENTIRDVRTFAVSEEGPAQLTQVVRYTGVFELEERTRARALRPELRKQVFGSRIESQFAGSLETS